MQSLEADTFWSGGRGAADTACDFDVVCEEEKRDPSLRPEDIAEALSLLDDVQKLEILQGLNPQLLLDSVKSRLSGMSELGLLTRDGASQEGDERRGSRRFRIDCAGSVNFNSGQRSLFCRVKDISKGGARIAVANTGGIPNYFLLDIEATGNRRECEVAWRSTDELGLKFVD